MGRDKSNFLRRLEHKHTHANTLLVASSNRISPFPPFFQRQFIQQPPLPTGEPPLPLIGKTSSGRGPIPPAPLGGLRRQGQASRNYSFKKFVKITYAKQGKMGPAYQGGPLEGLDGSL
jgi:hypothetical protein